MWLQLRPAVGCCAFWGGGSGSLWLTALPLRPLLRRYEWAVLQSYEDQIVHIAGKCVEAGAVLPS